METIGLMAIGFEEVFQVPSEFIDAVRHDIR
jgi:hypothetical protein